MTIKALIVPAWVDDTFKANDLGYSSLLDPKVLEHYFSGTDIMEYRRLNMFHASRLIGLLAVASPTRFKDLHTGNITASNIPTINLDKVLTIHPPKPTEHSVAMDTDLDLSDSELSKKIIGATLGMYKEGVECIDLDIKTISIKSDDGGQGEPHVVFFAKKHWSFNLEKIEERRKEFLDSLLETLYASNVSLQSLTASGLLPTFLRSA